MWLLSDAPAQYSCLLSGGIIRSGGGNIIGVYYVDLSVLALRWIDLRELEVVCERVLVTIGLRCAYAHIKTDVHTHANIKIAMPFTAK